MYESIFICGLILFVVVLCALLCVYYVSVSNLLFQQFNMLLNARKQKISIIYDPESMTTINLAYFTKYIEFLNRRGYKNIILCTQTISLIDTNTDVVIIWKWNSGKSEKEISLMHHDIVKFASNASLILLSNSSIYNSLNYDGINVINDISKLRSALDDIVEIRSIN